jgi:hypothetical protein
MATFLETLVAVDAPQQFVCDVLAEPVARECRRLALPGPRCVAGNLVIGDLGGAEFVLVAHLDEASFSVTGVDGVEVTVAACHRLSPEETAIDVRFLGVRDGAVRSLGDAVVVSSDGRLRAECGVGQEDIRLGDRAVYGTAPVVTTDDLTAKAIDDRAGSVIALHAAAELIRYEVPVAVVLSDGEQNVPDGYFSRTFPHILGMVRPSCRLVFIGGVWEDGLSREGLAEPPVEALVVPHSADGRGYTVPPRLFALLRDELVPAARAEGTDVRVSGAYHSRGDDWGLVTNPTAGANLEAFFVSFSGMGRTPARRTITVACLANCRRFVVSALKSMAARG